MCAVSIAVAWAGLLVSAIMTAFVFRPPTPVERLKDALLSLALLRAGVCADAHREDYLRFDGTALPFSSSDPAACFHYITTPYDRAFSRGRSHVTAERNTAIERYLARNLSSNADVRVFFHAFSDLPPPLGQGSTSAVATPRT
jgi:hypothetical protein